MYQIESSGPVRKDLRKIPKEALRILDEHIKVLKSNPYQGEPLKKLLKGLFKYEFAHKGTAYRIAYRVFKKEKVVLIEMIGSRENFYSRLKRRLK